MEQKGEFEQRPEVKPADQIPLPKAKANPLPWILCAVLAVAVIGLGIFIAVNGVGGEKKSNNGSGSTIAEDKKPEEKPEEPEDSEEKIIARINEIFDAAKAKMKEAKIKVDGYSVSENKMMMHYVLKEGYVTTFDRTTLILDSETKLSDTDAIAARTAFVTALKELGFSNTATLENVGDLGSLDKYYSDENGYVCEYSQYNEYLACGHSSWISDEKKKSLIDMIDQYQKYVDEDVTYMYYPDSAIKDSPTKPYQTVTTDITSAVAIYYRKDADSKWIYVGAGQGVLDCVDSAKTEDAKKALSGTIHEKNCRYGN